jgi:hypothetical protein
LKSNASQPEQLVAVILQEESSGGAFIVETTARSVVG